MEDRLKYFETGQIPKKNMVVMKEASEQAEGAIIKVPIIANFCKKFFLAVINLVGSYRF